MKTMFTYFGIGLLLCLSGSSLSQPSAAVPDIAQAPKIKWTFTTKAPIFSAPIADEQTVYFGGTDSTLYALDLQTGSLKWTFRTGDKIRSAVCICQDCLLLNGGDGYLYALDKQTGKLLWKFASGGEKKYDFADYFHATPVVHNQTVFWGSGDGNLYALHVADGSLAWKFASGGIVHTTPAIDQGRVFFGSMDGYVYALQELSGELVWKFKTVGHRYFPLGEVQGSPCAFNGMVYIGARDYNVYALDQEKGFCYWNKAYNRGWALCNQVQDSILYIGSADERVLIAADPTYGKELWNRKMEFLVFGNNAYSQNLLYVGTTMGKLHGINRHTGETTWSFNTDSYLNKRQKYFKPDDSYRDDIYSIIRSNEQFLDVELELGGIFTTPLLVQGMILFTSTNGLLYCLQ